jgi:hypothetical protein
MENIKIVLSAEDIKGDRTMSGRLIDKVAVALDKWTEDELMENNIDYENEGALYLIKEYDYEARLLELLNKPRTLTTLDALMVSLGIDREQIIAAWHALKKYPRVKYGAAIALGDADLFTALMSDFEDAIKEADWGYNDEDSYLYKFAPELAKKMQDSIDEFYKDLTHEWLYGDRDSAGLLRDIEKFFDAESVDYNAKNDTMGLEFTPEAAGELIDGFYSYDTTKKTTARNLKAALVDDIAVKMEARADEEKAKREKRAAENKETREYQAKRKTEEEADRIAKLKAMAK